MLERLALGTGALTSRPLSRGSWSGPASESSSVEYPERSSSSSGGGLERTGASIFQTMARSRFNLRAGTGLGEMVASRITSFCGRYQEKFSDLLENCVMLTSPRASPGECARFLGAATLRRSGEGGAELARRTDLPPPETCAVSSLSLPVAEEDG
jgi:hypothetical protein